MIFNLFINSTIMIELNKQKYQIQFQLHKMIFKSRIIDMIIISLKIGSSIFKKKKDFSGTLLKL